MEPIKTMATPSITKIFKDFVPSATNPLREYIEYTVSEAGELTPTGRRISLKDDTHWQTIGDYLDALTLNGYTGELNQFAKDLEVYVDGEKMGIEDYIRQASELMDSKIAQVNLITPPSVHIENGTTIVFDEISSWTPREGALVSFVMKEKLALATHIQICGVKYPCFTNQQEQVKDFKANVAYMFSYGGGSFFTNKGNGSGVVEVGGILVTESDFSYDDRYVSLPYTFSDSRLTELGARYPLNTSFSYPTPKAPYKAYMKIMTSPLPDGESFTPNDGSFTDWIIGTTYWFKGEAPNNLDLGRNSNGTYKIGEFVLCNGQSIETFSDNTYSSVSAISVPNMSDLMYPHCKAYKLVERDVFLGTSGSNPFKPITLNNSVELKKDGVYFIKASSLYGQSKYRTHLCNGDKTDELLERTYEYMPNYSTLNTRGVLAVYCDGPLELGDYALFETSNVPSNFTAVNGSAVSIQSISLKNPLISNAEINRLEGSLTVKNEEYSDPNSNGRLTACIKLGDYIYTEGKPRSDGWKVIRFDAVKGVTSQSEYAPKPSELNTLDLGQAYSIEISKYSFCIHQGNKFYFTQDYVTWEVNDIAPWQNNLPVTQIGPSTWVSYGGISHRNEREEIWADACYAVKTSATSSWRLETDQIITTGAKSRDSGYRNARASLRLMGYDGKGSACFEANTSVDVYIKSSGDSWTMLKFGMMGCGRLKPSKFEKSLTDRSELLIACGSGCTSKVSYRDSYVSFGGYWYQSTKGWDEHAMEAIKREYDYNAFFDGDNDGDYGRRSYSTTDSNTMNYKGSYSGVRSNYNVSTGTWYSNAYYDTGTETLTTPMTIAGFSDKKPVMQSYYRLKNKISNIAGVGVYVRLT